MTGRVATTRARRVLALLAASSLALTSCKGGEIPQREDPLVEIPGPGDSARVTPECQRGDLEPYCSEAEVVGEARLVDQVPAVEKVGRSSVSVTPRGQVVYRVRLQAPDATRGSVVQQYSFVFEGWEQIQESGSLLVYRKRLDTAAFVATIRISKSPAGGPGFLVDARLATATAVLPP